MRHAIVELKKQGAKSFVIDLRGNGGGLLNEAVEIVNLFVPKNKTIVTTKGKTKHSNEIYKTLREPIDTESPIAILVDGQTASASEIVAGSLQDLDRAVIIGSRTFGKGLVQSTRQVNGGYLKLTTAKYYIPSGRCHFQVTAADNLSGALHQSFAECAAANYYSSVKILQ